ncbi:MAG: ABC transporter permease [Gemmatimonadales bacterium]
MDTLAQDLRYAVRALRKSPGFTLVVVLTLALGIGPNAAIFSVIYGVLLRPLPYHEPENLVRPRWQWQSASSSTDALTATQYVFWKERNRVFEAISAYARPGAGFNIVASGEPTYVRGQYVAWDLFPLLGIPPAEGRSFTEDEDQQGGPPVAMVSHALTQRLGGAPDAVGRGLEINGTTHTVIGVMPAGFALDGDPVDLWLPLRLRVSPRDQGHNTMTIARLKSGVTLEQAQADMGRLLAELHEAYPGHVDAGERGVLLRPYHEELVGDVRGSLLLLMGAVGLVLLIATANAAALFLGRANARSHEFAVRTALGASRLAAMRPLLVESVLLSLAGGVVGLLFADWSLGALLALGARDLPFLGELAVDGAVLTVTFGVAVTIGVVAGILPALKHARRHVGETLHWGDRALGGARQRMRTLLVGGEVALSTALLAGSVLLIVSIHKLWNTDPGFDPENVWTVQMSVSPQEYGTQDDVLRFSEEVRRQFASLPGVRSVTTASSLPLERGANFWIRAMKGGARTGQVIELRAVGADYFTTLGIPLLRGRPLDGADRRDAPAVVVVNRRLAEFYWPDRNPVGETVWIGPMTARVVGVVADVREFGLDADPPPLLYVPAAQMPEGMGRAMRGWFLSSWIIKGAVPPGAQAVQRMVAAVDPTQPVVNVRAMDEVVGAWLAPRRFVGQLLNVFTALALVLATIGVYGVVSYNVSQRQRELGLRAALGADRLDLIGMVLSHGFRLAMAGALVGTMIALFATRFLRGFLFGVSPQNPIVLATACLGLTVVVLTACYVPARRAASVDPMVALRNE